MLRLSLLSSLLFLLASFVNALPSLPRAQSITILSVSKSGSHPSKNQNGSHGRVLDTTTPSSGQAAEKTDKHLLSYSPLSTEAETSSTVVATQSDQTLQLSDILSIANSELRKRGNADVKRRQLGSLGLSLEKRAIQETRSLNLGKRAYTIMTSNMYIESIENDEDIKFLLAKEKRNIDNYTRNNLAARGITLRSDVSHDITDDEIIKRDDMKAEEGKKSDDKKDDDEPKDSPPNPPDPMPATTSSNISTLSTLNVQNGLATNNSCAPMIVVYAKGSFEKGNVGAIAGPPLFASLAAVLGESALQIQGVNYEAGIGGFTTGGNAAGSTLMATTVKDAMSRCPDSKMVMAGYSQGAQLVHNAASQLPPTTLAAVSSVVTFGDPFNGSAITSGGTTLTSNVLAICHDDDKICMDKGIMIGQSHLDYARDAGTAAAFVAMMSGLGMGIDMNGNNSRLGLGS